MQASSIRRWPLSGSRPVVSVSRTISRAITPSLAPFARPRKALAPVRTLQFRDDGAHLLARMIEALAGVDDEMGAGALLLVGHLTGEDAVELGFAHPFARQDPLALHIGRRGDHDDGVHVSLAAGLEEQRDVEHHDRNAVFLGLLEE